MTKIITGIGLCLMMIMPICAQQKVNTTALTLSVIDDSSKEPLIGAAAYFEELQIGDVTDENGVAIFENLPLGKGIITLSFIGYESITDTLDITENMPIKTYSMHPDEGIELDGVTIKATRSTRTIKKIPTRIEFINAEELGEKAVMNAANISTVLRESTGIQVQQTSLSSANNSIRIQGLDGKYTQLLKDGFPLYGGFSSGLSIMQIPPLDLNQFEIIKGSSSTLYGGGAIAGLVNMVSKTPTEEPELDIMLSQTHTGGSTANVFYSSQKGKIGYTLYGSGYYQKIYDPDKDDFSNLPKTTTFSFNPKIFYNPSQTAKLWIGINATHDKREGGDLTAIKEGKHGIHQYTALNTSTRISSQSVYEKTFHNDQALQFKNSVSYFDRELKTTTELFSGTQWNVFSELNYTLKSNKSDWIFGTNFYSNSFKEKENPTPRNQKDITVGVFANNTTDLSEKFILETGFRMDYAKEWGFFPLPRISLLWKAGDHFSSRLGGGLGYKLPDIFTEEAAMLNFQNISPINANEIEAENSYGANIDFNYKTRLSEKIGFSINQLFYLTSIDKALLLDHENGTYKFKNAPKSILSKGSESNIKFTYGDFRWFLNYAYINTTLNYLPGKPQKPLTAKHMAGTVLMYENEKWRIGYETYYTGKQQLASGVATQDFFTLGLLVQKHFKWGSPYVNFENMTDRRQSRFSPETLPPHHNPKFAEIYAPTDGFVFTAGVIIYPFGKKHEHH